MATKNNLVYFNGTTRLNIDPDRVLSSALEELEEVVVVGYDKDGKEYFASSVASGADVLWLLERAKVKLLVDPYISEDE